MKTKTFFLLFLLFILINVGVYKFADINMQQRFDLVISDHINTLESHYEILLHSQKIASQNLYKRTIETENFLDIMSEAKTANEKRKATLRKELYTLLSDDYNLAKNQGVLQYQFVFPDNTSFLRMHKPDKFGDDLTKIREDFEYTNRTKEPIRGFAQGRTAHGFRNTFPIFDKNKHHIGAMEVSFSSDGFQDYLTNISNIHTHFIVKKDIFDAKIWERDDVILKYKTSAEHPNYMMAMNDQHTDDTCIVDNKIKLEPVKAQIIENEKLEEAFGFHVKHEDFHMDVVAFIPIENIDGDLVGWLVSYEPNAFIELTIQGSLIIRSISFFASLFLIYFVYTQIKSKEKIKHEHSLLNDVLSTTDDIIFVTDFKTIGFSNRSFRELLNIKHSSEYTKNILDIFCVEEGVLHKELLKSGESFIDLIKKTPESQRIVRVVDNHFSAKTFKIDIVQTTYKDKNDYLVTLTDVTKIQEEQLIAEKKAYTDGLTGVYNRRKFDELIVLEVKNARRSKTDLSIAILDIDKFKDFNDVHGHLIGDEVLIMLANHIQDSIRETDVFARWGGEEFVILFRGITAIQAKNVSDKIRESLSKLEHETAGHVSASFGVTELKKSDTVEEMFARCDKALYKAKENGRDRVEVL